jgi:hypothetical protein
MLVEGPIEIGIQRVGQIPEQLLPPVTGSDLAPPEHIVMEFPSRLPSFLSSNGLLNR